MYGVQIKQLIYDPFMYDYFLENDIDIKRKLAKLLVKTKFEMFMGMTESEIKETIDHLPFNRKIVFDYELGVIENEWRIQRIFKNSKFGRAN